MLASITGSVVAMHRLPRGAPAVEPTAPASCTQTSELKLKFVAHVGEVAIQIKPAAKARRPGRDLRPSPAQEPCAGARIRCSPRISTRAARPPDDLMHEISQDRRESARAHLLLKVGDLPGPLARCRILRAPARRRDGCHPRPRSAVQAPPAALTSSRPDSPVRNSCREAQSASLAA